MLETLQQIAGNFQLWDFESYRASRTFDIYLYKADHRIELALLRGVSKPHYHLYSGTACFYFLDRGIIQLGRCKDGKHGILRTVQAHPGDSFRVAPGVLHAAGPDISGQRVRLLIMNPNVMRLRGSNAYPEDTYFPETIEYLEPKE